MWWSVEYVDTNHTMLPTPPHQRSAKTVSGEMIKVFSSGSDRKMPTQAHQIILIKQLYRGSTAFLMSKYYWSELPPPIFCVCVCGFETEHIHIPFFFVSCLWLKQWTCVCAFIHHNAWPKCSTVHRGTE